MNAIINHHKGFFKCDRERSVSGLSVSFSHRMVWYILKNRWLWVAHKFGSHKIVPLQTFGGNWFLPPPLPFTFLSNTTIFSPLFWPIICKCPPNVLVCKNKSNFPKMLVFVKGLIFMARPYCLKFGEMDSLALMLEVPWCNCSTMVSMMWLQVSNALLRTNAALFFLLQHSPKSPQERANVTNRVAQKRSKEWQKDWWRNQTRWSGSMIGTPSVLQSSQDYRH